MHSWPCAESELQMKRMNPSRTYVAKKLFQVPLILFEVYANLDQDRTFWCVASGALNTIIKCHVPANKRREID